MEAKNAPYIVTFKENPVNLAHAITLASYNHREHSYIYSSGSYGEDFGDKGVVKIDTKYIDRYFAPLGFNISIF